MEPIIDEEETFGVEIEGIISGSEPSEPCYGEYCDCIGGCTGTCHCEDDRTDMRNENLRSRREAGTTLYRDIEIENHCCPVCSGECGCSYCEGECGCDVCNGCCDCRTEAEDRNRHTLAHYINDNAGVDCRAEGWNTETRDYWKVIYDGSVHGAGEDCEVISPPIKGRSGLNDLRRVVQCMEEFGVVVNTSTGLHVHHDTKNVSTDALAMLVQVYAFYEGILDTFQPKSRRGQNAGYCRSIKSFFGEDTAKDVFQRIKCRLDENDSGCEKIGKVYNKGIKDTNFNRLFRYEYRNERYCKLNLHSYYKHGTVEFRHHAGTVDAEKICNWVELTQALIKYCQKKKSRITGKHKPTFKKLMELVEVREEIFNFYDSRRKHFAEKYGKVDFECTDHKRGYK